MATDCGHRTPFSKPARFENVDAVQGTTTAGEELNVLSLEGRWANVDIWIDANTNWFLTPNGSTVLRIYAKTRAGRHLIRKIPLWAVQGVQVYSDSRRGGIIARVRGWVADGFDLTLEWQGGRGFNYKGTVIAHAWGKECAQRPDVWIGIAPSTIELGNFTPPNGAIGLPATQISGGASVAIRGLRLQSSYANAAGSTIWVGDANTAFNGPGHELRPGDTITLEIADAALAFAVGSAAGLSLVVEILT